MLEPVRLEVLVLRLEMLAALEVSHGGATILALTLFQEKGWFSPGFEYGS